MKQNFIEKYKEHFSYENMTENKIKDRILKMSKKEIKYYFYIWKDGRTEAETNYNIENAMKRQFEEEKKLNWNFDLTTKYGSEIHFI